MSANVDNAASDAARDVDTAGQVLAVVNDCIAYGLVEIVDHRLVITELGYRTPVWKVYIDGQKRGLS
jgi:hypothetical protein